MTHHFGFGSPVYLLALVVVALLLALAVALRRRRSRYTVAFTNLGVLNEVVAARGRPRRGYVALLLLPLALVFAAAALARPHIQLTTSNQGTTVVLLADVSGSMAAPDVYPTRIGAARRAMQALVQELPKNDRVGLITFSDQVEVVNEPTTDHAAVVHGLDLLRPEGGTALGLGVQAAVESIVSSLSGEGVQHVPGEYLPAAIVLESDGAQNRGNIDPLAASELARTAGIRIYGVALGTRKGFILEGQGLLRVKLGVPPDPGTVALLARETNGVAFQATDAGKLNTIYRNLGSSVGRRPNVTNIASWFDLVAAVLLACGVAAARLWGGALP